MHVNFTEIAVMVGWLLAYIGGAIVALFLIGLCGWLCIHHGQRAMMAVLRLPQRLVAAKRHRRTVLSALHAVESERHHDESLLAQDGIYVDLSRSGPDERGSSKRLARLRGSPDRS
jgi:hypothetical protein